MKTLQSKYYANLRTYRSIICLVYNNYEFYGDYFSTDLSIDLMSLLQDLVDPGLWLSLRALEGSIAEDPRESLEKYKEISFHDLTSYID